MRIRTGASIKNQKGFTLVELLVVIAIMSVALAAVYQFFFFTHNSYARADAQSAITQETDLLFLQLEKDIRSASEPNNKTKSVRIIADGQGLDVYSHKDGQYYRTSYRVNGSDLQRGFISASTHSDSANPQYGTITNWQTIVTNLMPGNTMIFDDSRNVDISVRRLVDVNVYIQHPQLGKTSHAQTAIMSRTGKSTASIEAYNSNFGYKKVAYIKFFRTYINPESGKVEVEEITDLSVPQNGQTIDSIFARAYAQDGSIPTNQNLLLKQNFLSISWSSFPDYSFLSGGDIIDVIENVDLSLDGYRDRFVVRSGQPVRFKVNRYGTLIAWWGNPRTVRILAESPDGVTSTLTLTQSH